MNDWIIPTQRSFKWKALSSLACLLVGATSKAVLKYLCSFKCYNRSTLISLIENNTKVNRPLITVTNHDSCIDDPIIVSECLTFKSLIRRNCRCLGQVIPIVRGDGVYQKSMNYALDELKNGGWVHIFPEGKVNINMEYIRFKWGVGRLVMDCQPTPIVLPLYHFGMNDLLPNKSPYIPQFFKKITLNIGTPIFFDEMVRQLKEEKKDAMEIRQIITSKIQEEMEKLKTATHKLHEKHVQNNPEPE